MKQTKYKTVAPAFGGPFSPECYRQVLEEIYITYTRPDLIHPDPVEFPRRYSDKVDREIAALIASSLAYGRVQQIHRSVERVLSPMEHAPGSFLLSASQDALEELYYDFRHRFTSGRELISFLKGVKRLLIRFGSLEECLAHCIAAQNERNVFKGITAFAEKLKEAAGGASSLLASPADGSACKRFFLFLKWMVRHDSVDPGGWTVLLPKDICVPVDTHMHKIGRSLNFTIRKQADLKTVMEITRAFQIISPLDPARYDFALTRFGIRAELEISDLIKRCSDGVSIHHQG